ncbi:TAP-like protein-domain-containing protein [Flammula alnicola]|nr:TAP-like protein-domain-containing protein [Flammula alnicola]
MLRRASSTIISGVLIIILGGTLLRYRLSEIASPDLVGQATVDGLDFSWEKARLPPSKELIWTDCAPGRQCARLLVPLDYSDAEGKEAAIALVRKPSSLPPTSKSYRGPLLFNPGGPGGSGVLPIVGPGGDRLSTIVGPQFDIVGFDPRGIGFSTPRVSFFKRNAERAIWGGLGLTVVNNSYEGVARTWARALVAGQLAAESDSGYLRHINTENTARDMLRIVEGHGKSKLQYWGFSYGTVLGAVFASLFPDRIERMVVDGVTDAEDYFATKLSTSLMDTNKALESFFTGCVEAGSEGCDFWAPTPEDIRQNLTKLYASVQSQPRPIKVASSYGLLDYAKLRVAVLMSLFTPYATFPLLARGLADLASGDGSLLFTAFTPPPFECSCDSSAHIFEVVDDAAMAIICNDGEDVPSNLESAEAHLKMMMNVSDWGEIWSGVRISCSGWPSYPKKHFRGPFQGNTSHPLLVIGNTADPVTPLWSAKRMAYSFNGSVVLTQDSSGHTSLSAPSLCTQQYVRKYFDDGTLPTPGTVCPVLGKPFPAPNLSPDVADEDAVLKMNMTPDGQEMFDAILGLSMSPVVSFLGL